MGFLTKESIGMGQELPTSPMPATDPGIGKKWAYTLIHDRGYMWVKAPITPRELRPEQLQRYQTGWTIGIPPGPAPQGHYWDRRDIGQPSEQFQLRSDPTYVPTPHPTIPVGKPYITFDIQNLKDLLKRFWYIPAAIAGWMLIKKG
ncbi:MAG TPA: hypothetical protein ENI27_03670 [bacterium]|nr:hypothetical protein [bacterium]